jgi:putative addiction module component (TIGR02574 family)
MKALSEVTKDALGLPPQQRVTLARILLDSSEPASSEIESAWEDEICRRIQAIQSGTAKSRSMDDVFTDLDRRFSA